MSVKAIYIVTVSLMKKPDGGTSWKVTPQKFSILATGEKDAEQCARKVVEQDEWIIQKGIQIVSLAIICKANKARSFQQAQVNCNCS